MRRERVFETINDLSIELDLETVIEQLIFIDKVEKGLNQTTKEKTLSHEEVKKEFLNCQNKMDSSCIRGFNINF